MSNIDSFKAFVKKNPELINQVKTNKMTWQKYYEIYNLYGEEESIWKDYVIKEKKEEIKKTYSWDTITNFTKNLDVDKVQESITSIQKTLGLVGELFTRNNKGNNMNQSQYDPRPVYRRFDD